MRNWLVVALLAHVAAAKPTPQAAVEQLVRAHVAEMPKHHADSVADTAVVYLDHGNHPMIGEGTKLGDNYYADQQADVSHVVTKLVVDLDDAKTSAWFQVQYDVTMKLPEIEGERKATSFTEPARAAGLAAKVGDDWKIVAIAYSALLSDKELLANKPRFAPTDLPKGDPAVKGDAALAKVTASWFKSGFASHAGKAPIASGSSPGEFQSGAGVDKLVKSWDKLGLVPREIEAAKVGTFGFVKLDVALPIKGKTTTAPLYLYLVLVPDGSDWKWVSLQYGTPMR